MDNDTYFANLAREILVEAGSKTEALRLTELSLKTMLESDRSQMMREYAERLRNALRDAK